MYGTGDPVGSRARRLLPQKPSPLGTEEAEAAEALKAVAALLRMGVGGKPLDGALDHWIATTAACQARWRRELADVQAQLAALKAERGAPAST